MSRNVILGVSGSIAAYRAADLARDLMRAGCVVRVCLTDAAQKFVSTALFEALTGQPCLVGTFEEPVVGRMAHIDWARQADLLVIAPATANTLAQIATGAADDMLTTIALAYEGPVVLAPAMNPSMYASEPTTSALSRLHERGYEIVEPMEGDVACGESGQGKLAANEEIVATCLAVLHRSQRWFGKRVLITSGPTREPIDSVRFLSNRSSGKMGSALARAALLMGADVDVVAGPQTAPLPLRANVTRVETAREMHEVALRHCTLADLVIGVAAVADYRPDQTVAGKIRRGADQIELTLVQNPDVLASVADACAPRKGKDGLPMVVGFAAEPGIEDEDVRSKMHRKRIDAIVANDIVRKDVGFDSDRNELTLYLDDRDPLSSGLLSKLGCALWLLEALADRIGLP